MECRSYYSKWDAVEKAFRAMKHDLLTLPLNAKKEAAIRGLQFVNLINLIICMRLLRLMKESKIIVDCTVENLLLELSKIKKFNSLMEISFFRNYKKENDSCGSSFMCLIFENLG